MTNKYFNASDLKRIQKMTLNQLNRYIELIADHIYQDGFQDGEQDMQTEMEKALEGRRDDSIKALLKILGSCGVSWRTSQKVLKCLEEYDEQNDKPLIKPTNQ